MPRRSAPLSASLALTLLALLAQPAPAPAEPFDYYGTGQDPRDTPGTPRTPVQIYRRLVEDGYEVLATPMQVGAVYFVAVRTPKGRSKCFILHAFSGVILQRLTVGPSGYKPEIKDAPGPGFPGYPEGPSGRFAELCAAVMPVITVGPRDDLPPIRERF